MQEDNRSPDKSTVPVKPVVGRVLALADAGPASGLGHLARSSAVVTALALRGISVDCWAHGADAETVFDGILWNPDGTRASQAPVDAVLLDSYELAEDDQSVLGPVACFYDGNRPEPTSAAKIVIAPAADPKPRAGWLAGLAYTCLRPAFWHAPAVEPSPAVRSVLISTGATDPDNVSEVLIDAVREAIPGVAIRRIRGPRCEPVELPGIVDVNAPSDLRAELRATDLVVCLGGQTALEAAALGVPTIAVALNDNQAANVERLAATGAVLAAGLDGDLARHVGTLSRDSGLRRKLSHTGPRVIDGFGALRVAAEVELLVRAQR